jgi:excisionase family DNA binding protein
MFGGQKPPENMGLLLTTKETAKLLKVSQNTVVSLCKEEKIPKPFRIGRSVRFRYEELRAWANAGCPTQAEWTFSPES